MGFLSDEELKQLMPAETAAFPAPIPTQSISSDEFAGAADGKAARVRSAYQSIRQRAGTPSRPKPARFFQDRRRHEGGLCRHERHPWGDLRCQSSRGAADGAIKRAILGENNARLYRFTPQQRSALDDDRFAQLKKDYVLNGAERSNLAYGYIRKARA